MAQTSFENFTQSNLPQIPEVITAEHVDACKKIAEFLGYSESLNILLVDESGEFVEDAYLPANELQIKTSLDDIDLQNDSHFIALLCLIISLDSSIDNTNKAFEAFNLLLGTLSTDNGISNFKEYVKNIYIANSPNSECFVVYSSSPADVVSAQNSNIHAAA